MEFSQLKELDLKYRFGGLFGIIALLLSFVVGILAGNDIGHVFVRSLIMTIGFVVLGFAAIYIIQRFVPEMLEMRGTTDLLKDDEEVEVESEVTESEVNDDEIDKESDSVSEEDESVPLSDSTFVNDYSDISQGEGKLGKHIIMDESKIKYEPKIMADAIRTMLKRDEE